MIEKILERLEETRWTTNFDAQCVFENAKLDKCIEIVQEVAKEYGNASDNDLTVVSALPSLYPLQKFEEEAIHKVVASAKDGGWIPCSERLPEDNERVLVIDEDGIMAVCRFVESVNVFMTCWDGDEFADVIAWQSLPAPYQKGE